MDNKEKIITGQCHCGQITYEAQGPILRKGICRCQSCQRATGALESPNIGVAMEHFAVTTGEPVQFRAKSGTGCEAGTWNICSKCGSQLYWINAAKSELAIFAGTLDDTNLFTND